MQGIILVSILLFHESRGITWLRADGNSSNTYSLIRSVLGKPAIEVPDCAHPNHERHITQVVDKTLNRPVFAFHVHTDLDNDRCIIFDRQRVEIKTMFQKTGETYSPSSLVGFYGETVTFSWNFWLDSKFQASFRFTHIHQIKLLGNPVITITARKIQENKTLEIIHVDRNDVLRTLELSDLSNFLGTWVHVKEELTYRENGNYSLVLSRLDNGKELMAVTRHGIDLWRDGIKYLRPKWGIYRSAGDYRALRDETCYFDSFCLSKGTNKSETCT